MFRRPGVVDAMEMLYVQGAYTFMPEDCAELEAAPGAMELVLPDPEKANPVESPENATEPAANPVEPLEDREYLDDFDAKLALRGLTWLKGHIDPKMSTVVCAAIARQYEITIEERAAEKAERRQSRLRESTAAEARELREAEARRQRARLARRAERTRERDARRQALAEEEARQLDRQRYFQGHLDTLAESGSLMDYGMFRELSAEVLLAEERPGTLVARELPGFKAKVVDRVRSHLENPAVVLNDVTADLELHASSDLKDAEHGVIIKAYTDKIGSSVAEALGAAAYSPEDFQAGLARWLDFVGGLPDIRMSAIDASGSGSETVPPYLHALVYGRGVLVNSLERIAQHQPKELIKTMYAMAEAELSPGNGQRQDLVLDVLCDCLLDKAPFALNALLLSMVFPYDEESTPKARELFYTLTKVQSQLVASGEVEVETESPRPRSNGTKWFGKATQALYTPREAQRHQATLKRCNFGRLMEAARRDFFQGFEAMPESERESTLYGRFVSAEQAQN